MTKIRYTNRFGEECTGYIAECISDITGSYFRVVDHPRSIWFEDYIDASQILEYLGGVPAAEQLTLF